MTAAEHLGPSHLDAALEYAARGWRVIPIPPGQKHPAIPAWQTAGTTDTDRIRHWFTAAPNDGIGIVTGPESRLFVLDIDITDGKAGDETLNELTDTYGPLPDTYTVITGTGGEHRYWNWPGIDIRNSASGVLGPGLDIRGTGGQVLAPPTIHPNGRRYTHEASSPLTVADAPGWLIALLTRDPTPPTPRPTPTAPTGDRPGDLWAAETSWQQILETDGWTLHHVDRIGEHHWTRPGKHRRDGTSATTGYLGSDVLKVFTSSHPHLAAEQTYTKLGYYAVTRHAGDHSAAASELARNGYRTPGLDLSDFVNSPGQWGTGTTIGTGTTTPEPPTWPTPTPLPDKPVPPPWPTGILPGWIEAQIANVANQIECPPDLPGTFALGALSTLALGHIQVQVRAGHTEHVAMFLVAAAPPSEGKSPALEKMFAPVYDHEERQRDLARTNVATAETNKDITAKKLSEAKANVARDDTPERRLTIAALLAELDQHETPPDGTLITVNTTPEKVAALMAANGERIAIVTDESGALVVDRYGDKRRGSNLDIYLNGWSGRKYTQDRVSAPPIRLRHPLLTIVIGAQPEAWATALADHEYRTRGLGARFMSSTPTPIGHLRTPDLERDVWDHAVAANYHNQLTDLARQWASWEHPAIIDLSPEARRAWTAWSTPMQARMSPDGDLYDDAGWVSKMRDTVLRVAGLIHLADGNPWNTPITADTMDRACRLGDYWTGHRLHDTTTDATDARRLLRALAKLDAEHPGELITKRDIGRSGPRGMRTIDTFAGPLLLLEEYGWVRIESALPAALRRDPIGTVRAADGIRVHPDASGDTTDPPRDTARQARPESTDSDRISDATAESREKSCVSRVSPYSDFETPPSYVEGLDTETPRDTRDKPPTDPAVALAAIDPDSLFLAPTTQEPTP